ncbi:MAG: hypothetical protein KG003_15510 [Bacteroidetes bacterium]|nr:hypothetical protein [Bacteroidota bacterium]
MSASLIIFQDTWNKKTWLSFLIFYLLILFFFSLKISINGLVIGGDSATYASMAEQILHGNTPNSNVWNPGYPYLMAIFKYLFGGSILHAAKYLHVFLFCLNSLLFLFAIYQTEIRRPIWIFLFSLLLPIFTSYRTEAFSMMAELPFITFLLLFLLQFRGIQNKISTPKFLLIIITLLSLYFIKPNAIAFAIAMVIWVWLQTWSTDVKWKYSAIFCFIFMAGVFAIKLSFGGYSGLQIQSANSESVLTNLFAEFGNIGAVFNGFVINSNVYFKLKAYHYIWTLVYIFMVVSFITYYLKSRKANSISASVSYSIIAIPLYVLIYLAVTTLSYPQVNPRTMLFPNILLLFCTISLAAEFGIQCWQGKLLYAMLLGFLVFGIGNKFLYSNPTLTDNVSHSLKHNHAVQYANQYLRQHPNTAIYCDVPKEAALFLNTSKVNALPGVQQWHGNEMVPINPDSLNVQIKQFANGFCQMKSGLVLIIQTSESQNKNLNFPCEIQRIFLEDGIIYIAKSP